MSIWYNKEYRKKFKKTDCPEDLGTTEEFVVHEAEFVSNVSQEDADSKARAHADEVGPIWANAIGGCCQVFYSQRQEGDFYSSKCPDGQKQRTPTHYVVEAGEFWSKDSVEDANEQARKAFMERGQAEADANGTCSVIYWNERQHGWYTKTCAEGWKSKARYKEMEAGKVYSFVSVEDANRLAKEKLDKEAQEWVEYNEKCEPEVGCPGGFF